MNSIFAWLDRLMSTLGSLFPRIYFVHCNEAHVTMVASREPTLHRSWYFIWPLITTAYEVPMNRRTLDIESQSLESKDGKGFVVDGTLAFTILDPIQFAVLNFEPDESLLRDAERVLRDVLTGLSWSNIQSDPEGIAEDCGTLASDLLSEQYGIEIEYFCTTNLIRARAFQLFQ
jgi:regulator of protease activity HflC (stomatin/prohibitin superfamily)